ncbi:MAG: glycosyltransferase family 2 protein [Ramlibacter sp.]
MTRLSVVVITKNEAANIAGCLRSAQFADELVVLDAGSSDATVALAREMGARVETTLDWPGFGPQKNRVLDLAGGEWVLSLDADERVSPALAQSIRAALGAGDFDAYSVGRHSSYCGQYMNHCGWYPDRVVRLFRRGRARFSDDLVHERVVTQRPVGHIAGDLWHASMDSFESVLDKVDRYSTAGAQALHNKGVKGSFSKALGHGLWAFLRTYLLRHGFLDGRLGFALAVSNAETTYYRYLKLWLLQRNASQYGARREPMARAATESDDG